MFEESEQSAVKSLSTHNFMDSINNLALASACQCISIPGSLIICHIWLHASCIHLPFCTSDLQAGAQTGPHFPVQNPYFI